MVRDKVEEVKWKGLGVNDHWQQMKGIMMETAQDICVCMEHEVEGPRPRGRPKKTWKEVVREDCQARKLNKEDAMDHCKWRKMIKETQ